MEWIVPFDSKEYDIEGCERKYNFIDWHQLNHHFNVGDIIYIYSNAPIQQIKYKFEVVKTDITLEESIDDIEFCLKPKKQDEEKYDRFFRIQLIEKYDEIKELNLSNLSQNGSGNLIRGTIKVNTQLSNYIKSVLSNPSNNNCIDNSIITKEKYCESIDSIKDDELDTKVSVKARNEQGYLRYYLFGNDKYGTCGICGKKLSVDMLTTSHIKKRCFCSAEEKKDYKHVVMPMCDLGCDKAFENGYIYVDNEGLIKINYNKRPTDDMIKTFKEFEDNKCEWFNEESSKYFEFHRNRFGIK